MDRRKASVLAVWPLLNWNTFIPAASCPFLRDGLVRPGKRATRRVAGSLSGVAGSVRDGCRRVSANIGVARACIQESESFNKILARKLQDSFRVAALGGKPRVASTAKRLQATCAGERLSLSNDGKMPRSCFYSTWTGDDMKEQRFLSACSASSQTLKLSSVKLSDPHNVASAQNKEVKGGGLFKETLPQSLAQAEKWEPTELILKQKQQVIQWKHSKVCVVCKKEVQAGALEKVESVCGKAWRFLNGYARSHLVCPLLTNMRLIQYAEAPLRDRARFDARLRRKCTSQDN